MPGRDDEDQQSRVPEPDRLRKGAEAGALDRVAGDEERGKGEVEVRRDAEPEDDAGRRPHVQREEERREPAEPEVGQDEGPERGRPRGDVVRKPHAGAVSQPREPGRRPGLISRSGRPRKS